MFSSIRKDTSNEVLRNLNINKKKEELKKKNKFIQNKNKKDLQANSLSDIVDLDENFEFILKNDVTQELVVEFMNQVFPKNILEKEAYEIHLKECFVRREFVSAFNFEYQFLRSIDSIFRDHYFKLQGKKYRNYINEDATRYFNIKVCTKSKYFDI